MCKLSKQIPKFNRMFNAFTLLEVILSISVFGIISVTLTSIVLNITSISSNLDRRNDILHLVNTIDAIISNEIRVSDRIVFCSQSAGGGFYVIRNFGNTVIFKLIKPKDNSIALQELNNEPTNCQFSVQLPTLTLSPNDVRINNFIVKYSSDGSSSQMIYVSFQVCDADNVPKQKVVFDCNRNPYRHAFAVSNKKL